MRPRTPLDSLPGFVKSFGTRVALTHPPQITARVLGCTGRWLAWEQSPIAGAPGCS